MKSYKVFVPLMLATIATVGLSACLNFDETEIGGATDPAETESAGGESTGGESADGDSAGGSSEPGAIDLAPGEGYSAELVRVVDGDSIVVLVDGDEVDIRFENYNSPELFDDDNDETCNGLAAKQALAEIVEGQQIALVGEETDRFGRTLAEVYVNGRSVTNQLIDDGRGLVLWDENGSWERVKAAAERRVGLWGSDCGLPETDGLIIGDTQANPPGRDDENLDQEWVEIINDSGDTIDLEGWTIRDQTTSNRFGLPGRLGPGARLKVRSGQGASTAEDLYLGETFPVWSNKNETVLLVDPSGVVATWLFLDES